MKQGVPEENNFLLTHLFVLYFILREMTHDEPASETQHQYDDGEYHSGGVGSVLNILLRGAQLEEHAQWEGGCLLVQSMRNMIGESCRKHHSGTIAMALPILNKVAVAMAGAICLSTTPIVPILVAPRL